MHDFMMIDPPWPKKKGGLRKVRASQTRSLDYSIMSVPDIFSLLDKDIFPLAADRHTVWLWTVDQFLLDAETEMKSRGYHLHARMIWDKGNGVAPAFTIRYSHEYLLWYTKNGLMKVDHGQRGKYTTIIRERSREHSRKPDSAYLLAETLYPQASRMDVFARESRPGWTAWGNETSKFDNAT